MEDGTVGLKADTSKASEMIVRVANAAGNAGLRKLKRSAVFIVREGVNFAFGHGVDPTTNKAWPRRKHSAGNPPLFMSGRLKNSAKGEAVIQGARLKIEMKVTSDYAKAGALFYGRRKSRTNRTLRGTLPPRPFMGITKSGATRFADDYRRLIREA